MAKLKSGKSKKEIHARYLTNGVAKTNKAAALARHVKAQPNDEQAALAVNTTGKDKIASSKRLYQTMTTATRLDASKPGFRGHVTRVKAAQLAYAFKVHRMMLPKVKRNANTRKAGKIGSLPGAEEVVAFFKGT